MTADTDRIEARDGTKLAHAHWGLAATPTLLVLIVHGLGEHGGRYTHVGEALAAAGFDVHAYDQRGFGSSEGPRADVSAWAIVHDDLEDVVRAVRATNPELPLALYGHSLGGLVALGYVLSERARPDLLALSAPAIDDRLAGWKHALTPAAARIAPSVRLPNGIAIEQLVTTPRPGLTYREDPLVLWQSSIRFGALGFAEQKRVRAALATLGRMPLPTYIARGTADPIVPVRAFERLEPLGGVTARQWPGMRHEIHNEADYRLVVGEIAQWLLANAPVRAAVAPMAAGAPPV